MNLTRVKSLAAVVIVWAVVYLPGLGSLEIQGEEGRRIFPAVEMLRGGSWVVPSVGGEAYYNKPPGINWLVAASFAVTGRQDELAARLPSVMLILAFCLVLVAMDSPLLTLRARLAGAVIFMTCLAMLEKGRLIEIEAAYVSLTGLATIVWLNAFARGNQPWRQWLIPCLLLAAGTLVKGPFLAVPFYALAVCVLVYSRKVRQFWSLQHIVGVMLMVGICLAWLVLARQHANADAMSQAQAGQVATRFSLKSFDAGEWAKEAMLGVAFFLPWAIFLPTLWMRRLTASIPPERMPIFKGCRLGMILGFAGLCIMTRLQSRYLLPAYPSAAILLGWVLAGHAERLASDRVWKYAVLAILAMLPLSAVAAMVKFGPSAPAIVVLAVSLAGAAAFWRMRARLDGGFALTMLTAATIAVAMLHYWAYVIPIRQSHERRRLAAAEVNRILPPGETLYVFRPGYQMSLFYIRQPMQYLSRPQDVGAQVRYLLLVPQPHRTKYRQGLPQLLEHLEARRPKVLYEFYDDDPATSRSLEKIQLLDCPPPATAAPVAVTTMPDGDVSCSPQ